MQCSILIIDDDKDFLNLVSRYLESNSFSVFKAYTAKEGMSILNRKKIDIVISDVDMPGINGFELLKSIKTSRKHSGLPVILMSGKKISEIDILDGYNKGNEDYIVKPFSLPVLLAKIKNIMRYRNICVKENVFKIGPLYIYEEQRKAVKGKEEIKLTRKEFDIILTLAKNKNKIFSVAELLDIIWGYDLSNNPHTVETHISSLRKKLGPEISKKIKNVSGYGYKLDL